MAVTQIINGETYIQIESNTVVSPGSPPDIDTDFHTEHRDDAFKQWQNCTAKTMSLACLPQPNPQD